MKSEITIYYNFPDIDYYDYPYNVYLPENYLEKKLSEEFKIRVDASKEIIEELELYNQLNRRYYDEIKQDFLNDAWNHCLKEFQERDKWIG